LGLGLGGKTGKRLFSFFFEKTIGIIFEAARLFFK
jgi:hypothetical protein